MRFNGTRCLYKICIYNMKIKLNCPSIWCLTIIYFFCITLYTKYIYFLQILPVKAHSNTTETHDVLFLANLLQFSESPHTWEISPVCLYHVMCKQHCCYGNSDMPFSDSERPSTSVAAKPLFCSSLIAPFPLWLHFLCTAVSY